LKKRLRIIVVDDCAELAQTFAQLLTGWGHEVTVALDGPQALKAAAATSFDVALLDLELPGIDGFTVAESLRKASPRKPILLVAVTGRVEEAWRQRAAGVGFDHFLAKPVPASRLEALLTLDENAISG